MSDTLSLLTFYLNPGNNGALLFEKDIKPDNSTEQRNYITAYGQVVAMVKLTNGTTWTTRYMHRDNLGSITAITDEAGTVIERLAYEPFGKRRFATGSDDFNNTIVPLNTDRGYTNHEHLDELTLVHMNGRVYDPVVGRFMSADPQIQDPLNLQSYNRYAYVLNNPLMYTDPSGYSFWTSFRDYVLKPAVAIAVAVYAPQISAAIGWTGGVSATGMAMAGGGSLALGITSGTVASGMLGGALAGAIMGGNLKSAVIGGISGGAFGWAGDIGQANGLYGAEHFAAHAAAGCLRGELGGGGCGRGALSAMAGLEGGRYDFIGAIIAGGTVSVIGGGKFGNGAQTAAFGYLFNDWAHRNANGGVDIVRDDGTIETRSGGSLSWRNNNPGNMRSGVDGYDSIGRNAGFAIFTDEETGFDAMGANLQTPRYQALTVGGAIATWAPGADGNNPVQYANQLSTWTGLSTNTPMNTLTTDQLNSVGRAIQRYEGWRSGTVTIRKGQ